MGGANFLTAERKWLLVMNGFVQIVILNCIMIFAVNISANVLQLPEGGEYEAQILN